MKLKSLALLISALSFSSFTHAETTSETFNTSPTKHFYAGAGLGAIGFFNNWNSSNDISINSSPLATNAISAQTGNANINSAFLAGYAWYLPKNTFLGVEIFDNMTNASSSLEKSSVNFPPPDSPNADLTINDNSSLTLQNVYGIRALPGYQFNPNTVLYGIVGFARAHATSSTYTSVNADNFTSSDTSDSCNFNGYQLGLGSQLNLNEHLALRADMIFTMYGTQTLANQTVTSSDGTNIQVETNAKPSTLEGDISLVYMFG